MPANSFTIDVNGDVLRWARVTAGQDTAEAAKKASVTEKTLIDWESGRTMPTWNSLARLARYYQRPVASLLLPEPPATPEVPTDFRNRSKSRAKLSPESLLAIRTARWLQSRAVEISRDMGLNRSFTSRRISTSNDHATIAQKERKKLGIDLAQQKAWGDRYEAFRAWKAAISEIGVFVFQFRFPRRELQGFSLFDANCPVIVLNENDSVEGRIFTLFHEYSHLLLRQPGMCQPSEVVSLMSENVEPFCNRFASSLLVPDSEVSQWSPKLEVSPGSDDAAIKDLAKRYRVSKDVILIKLRTAGRLSESSFKRIYDRWNKDRTETFTTSRKPPVKQNSGPSAYQKCIRQRGTAFIDLVLNAMKQGTITDHDALNYLSVKIKDLDKFEKQRQ